MNKKVLKHIKSLQPGDLIRVDWTDASIGKSLASGTTVDIPVKSWGIYVAILGRRKKHIVVAQNRFEYSNNLYDVDYVAIPISWTLGIIVIAEQEVSSEEAALLLKSFLAGRCRTLKRRTRNHARMD
jgi:acetamidase/formamidase